MKIVSNVTGIEIQVGHLIQSIQDDLYRVLGFIESTPSFEAMVKVQGRFDKEVTYLFISMFNLREE